MPNGKTHRAISMKRTGKEFAALHAWMDKDEEGLGVDHRKERHFYTRELKDYVAKNFGGAEAVSEWLFHIALDNLDTSVNNDWNFNGCDVNFYRFGFKPNGFVFVDEEELDDDELEEEFSDTYKKYDYKW